MNAFTVDFVSPVTFEGLAAEISFNGQLLCRVDRERPDGALDVEFFHEHRFLERDARLKFPVSDFLQIFNEVCDELTPR